VFTVLCGSDVCDGLINRSEESHCVWVCLIVCDPEISKGSDQSPIWAGAP